MALQRKSQRKLLGQFHYYSTSANEYNQSTKSRNYFVTEYDKKDLKAQNIDVHY